MNLSWMVLLGAGIVFVLSGLGAAVVVRRRRRALRGGAASPEVGGSVRDELRATRQCFAARLAEVFAGAVGDPDRVFSGLEEALIAVDVGGATATALVARVQQRIGRRTERATVEDALREEMETILAGPGVPEPSRRPWIVLVTGVNGVGKTTTIGKLASVHRTAGRRVLLVAADTFRAAAAEQLAIWAERAGAELVRQAAGASPAAVVFDGLRAAVARMTDVVLIDTAGRLHTRANLMEELHKIRRVIEREIPDAPHETLLVMDATTGQNAMAQARNFVEAVGVTGLIMTKLDGTARGGVLFAVRRELGVPILYLGHGEGVADLRAFDAGEFVAALFQEEKSDVRESLTLTRRSSAN